MKYFSLFLLLLIPLKGFGQDNSLNLFFFEKSYASVGTTPDVIGAPAYYIPEPDLFAEAQLTRHIALHRGMTGDMIFGGDSEGARWNFMLTTQFRFRALDVPSLPIRSMSALPRFTVQRMRSKRQPGADSLSGPRRISGLKFVTGHHSNGGDGCIFVDEVINADGECIATVVATPDMREVQTEGGNHSTNYVELGFFQRWGVIHPEPHPHWGWSLDLALTLQAHHNLPVPIPGGAEPAFRDIYGHIRPRVDMEYNQMIGHKGAIRFWVSGEYFDPKYERYPDALNYRLESTLLYHFAFHEEIWWKNILNNIAIGVRYSRGQDYYNLQFVRDISYIQPLIVIDTWSPWKSRGY